RWGDWLDPASTDSSRLHALLAPAASVTLASYPVSTLVNSVRNNGPALIEPLPPDQDGDAPGRGSGGAAGGGDTPGNRGGTPTYAATPGRSPRPAQDGGGSAPGGAGGGGSENGPMPARPGQEAGAPGSAYRAAAGSPVTAEDRYRGPVTAPLTLF